jgi:predicted nuclease of predicted toxin-antitoxin system
MLAFLADMPVPQSVVELARDLGHDARHVREYAMQRATDLVILQRAVQEQRILLTMDLGFSREMILTDL